MWLSLFCLLLIAGIAFYQSIHGLLSSLIFCVWTMVCTALAFALYQYVAFELLMGVLGPKSDFALPIALVVCFVVPLIGGRVALDHFIQRAGLLAVMVDRVGGLLFGVITALLLVGVMVTAIQMLPFGGRVLGFARFDPQSNEPLKEHAIWLSPDRFAVGMASMFSSGVFSGDRALREDHPDLLAEIGWSQAAVPVGCRHLAKPGAIRLTSATVPDYVYTKVLDAGEILEYKWNDPRPRHEFLAVSFVPGADAEDFDNQHRFTLPQIRMVGKDRDGRPQQYIPMAVRDSQDVEGDHIKNVEEGSKNESVLFKLWEPGDDGEIRVTFEVPVGFEPEYLVYKTGARVKMTKPRPEENGASQTRQDQEPAEEADAEADQTPPEPDPPSGRSSRRSDRRSGSTSTGGGSRASGDRVSGVRATQAKSFFGDQLPVTLTQYSRLSAEGVEVSDGAMQVGHVVASLEGQGRTAGLPAITRFEVPTGKRLLQLDVQRLRAGSTLGRALNFAVTTLRNYLVTDDVGEKYELVGQYAIANVDGEQVIEVQYFPQQIGSMGRGVGQFDRIKKRHLEQRDTTLVYLFLVNTGRQVVEFSTGRGGANLRGENLVAK
ncbi:MAG TPA: CvpA family protein [Phycisphaerae bacterium]|nr:CvpA family protein [Phycisphaerae bacterium]